MTASPSHLSASGAIQRKNILDTALTLMAQRGVDGTSMRDLASAAGLNVASLYHYFPSKRDLLVAVLEERGVVAATPDEAVIGQDEATKVEDLVFSMLSTMMDLEKFIRLMLGEVMRSDETAHNVGVELISATQSVLETWLEKEEPELCKEVGIGPIARLIRSVLIGLFFEHVAGTLEGDIPGAFRQRADELGMVLRGKKI